MILQMEVLHLFLWWLKLIFEPLAVKTVSTAHSIKCLVSGILHFKRKQQRLGFFNKTVSLCSGKISSHWFSKGFTPPKRSLPLLGTKSWIVFFSVFLLVSNFLVNISWKEALFSLEKHWLNFFSLKLNCSTTERWTEKLIFFISLWSTRFLYQVTKKPIFIPKIFLFILFLSLSRHQSHHRDGCQAIGINYCFICALLSLRFWQTLCHLISLLSFIILYF